MPDIVSFLRLLLPEDDAEYICELEIVGVQAAFKQA
jgi:hypothetical protein